MPLIHLTNFIEAPLNRVFDLSRSIDLFKHFMVGHANKTLNGAGLMNLEEEIILQTKYLFRERTVRIRLTEWHRPDYFVEEQTEGIFLQLALKHYFKPAENGTIIINQLYYKMKHGFIGKLIDRFYLNKYLIGLFTERTEMIKHVAENNQWQQYIDK